MASIDRIDWHCGRDFQDNLPEVNGGTHIGMYLTWIIQNDLIGQLHLDDSLDELQKVKSRQITGRDFLVDQCDEKFWDEDLSEEVLAFTLYFIKVKVQMTLKPTWTITTKH